VRRPPPPRPTRARTQRIGDEPRRHDAAARGLSGHRRPRRRHVSRPRQLHGLRRARDARPHHRPRPQRLRAEARRPVRNHVGPHRHPRKHRDGRAADRGQRGARRARVDGRVARRARRPEVLLRLFLRRNRRDARRVRTHRPAPVGEGPDLPAPQHPPAQAARVEQAVRPVAPMDVLDRERWLLVSRRLDEALALDEDERAPWLSTLCDEDAALAADVQMLLDEHHELSDSGFLETSPPTPPRAGLAGQTVGAYTVVEPIGQGGMGTVWLARRNDGRFDRRVAVKFLNVALIGRGEQRFTREGALLARLTHPHIAQLVDAGVSPAGQPFLILEHVDGEPIDRYGDRLQLGVDARVRLLLDVLDAVAHAHANLIVHRDIKPSNVLVDRGGHVKLLDFGIAKLLDTGNTAVATMLTREGGVGMTPEYAAPEQMTGAPITTATDVYALGVLAYLLLAGRHPAGDADRK